MMTRIGDGLEGSCHGPLCGIIWAFSYSDQAKPQNSPVKITGVLV